MMEPVVVQLLRRRTVRGGDGFEVFGDRGTGTIDTTAPLTDRPQPYWEGLPGRRGHLLDAQVSGFHLDNVMPDEHLSDEHVRAEHLWPAVPLTFRSRPLYFGRFRFAAGIVDAVGNRSAELSPVVERVVNSSPRRASSATKLGFDEVTRRLTLAFTPSPDL